MVVIRNHAAFLTKGCFLVVSDFCISLTLESNKARAVYMRLYELVMS